MSTLRGRRIYEAPSPSDGKRVLVDRLWPRGLSKDAAHIDVWPKSLTPSAELRKWYHAQGPDAFEEFSSRYEAELAAPEAAAALDELRKLVAAGPVTLLTASKDVEHSHVAVLLRVLG
ncbi:DUF488 domain-containing protein [Streptomyces indicus]|uniref:Uncharacterized conserved protein YeaO, DUF488 family n=1 Tax=Streptomyces indicus TaxID=417292 RepID=A0A1G9EWC7_9ACTN|nr:DUF488 family protein [Streptomyces indicus]SDK80383.1 Uncharacterized conserved protein YeaO, DUF488 family [Streptomyces indicus]